MTSRSQTALELFLNRAYTDGLACHGDLSLKAETFATRLKRIAEVHLGTEALTETRLEFLSALHTNDLYLSISCMQSSEAGWRRFDACYRPYLAGLASFTCRSTDAGTEIADRVINDMFLPDQLGQPRIATFDGRVPLAAWLRAIVTYRAFKERNRLCNNLEWIESLPEMVDENAVRNVDGAVKSDRYEAIARDALGEASRTLTSRERTILLLRYEEQLHAKEIARIYAVNPSTITRAIQRACNKLKVEVVSVLSSKYRLGDLAINECVDYILENPRHSILTLIRSAEKAMKASQ